ncbi:hypothetical protein KM043_011540 [Ampulex compressa]|nr:hypothetical protein KM043_011540 [Ampulex compressa]
MTSSACKRGLSRLGSESSRDNLCDGAERRAALFTTEEERPITTTHEVRHDRLPKAQGPGNEMLLAFPRLTASDAQTPRKSALLKNYSYFFNPPPVKRGRVAILPPIREHFGALEDLRGSEEKSAGRKRIGHPPAVILRGNVRPFSDYNSSCATRSARRSNRGKGELPDPRNLSTMYVRRMREAALRFSWKFLDPYLGDRDRFVSRSRELPIEM